MTVETRKTRAAEIHDSLDHPIVDADGHIVEFMPALTEFVRDELGAKAFERYQQDYTLRYMPVMTTAERRRIHLHQGTWGGLALPDKIADLATSFLPDLLASRMDDLGLDFTVLYGTFSLRFTRIEDPELRQGACRAMNRFVAEFYGKHADRMAPAAFIPMHTPEEAIAGLEHAKQLGLKVAAFPPGVMRPIEAYADQFPRVHWWDTYGLDSQYDYDPVWAKCVELGYAATFHGGAGMATVMMTSKSITNTVYNHIGSHAFLQQQLCKSLFLGGVTRRFPTLTFGFLECGAAWACQLLANLEEYWEKRNAQVMEARDLKYLDRNRFQQLLADWGGSMTAGRLDLAWLDAFAGGWPDSPPENRDEWRFLEIQDEHDIADLFVPNFYFGCEADDPSSAYCFSPANAFGAELKPVLSSDIGHWDVLDMEEVLPDSYKLVERGAMTLDQYRKFTFANPAMLHLRMNPNFFKGTKVEAAAERLLAEARQSSPAS